MKILSCVPNVLPKFILTNAISTVIKVEIAETKFNLEVMKKW